MKCPSTGEASATVIFPERQPTPDLEYRLKKVGWRHTLVEENHETAVHLSESPACPWDEYPANAVVFSEPIFIMHRSKPID